MSPLQQTSSKLFSPVWIELSQRPLEEEERLRVRLTDQDDENGQWEGDNRERSLPGAD